MNIKNMAVSVIAVTVILAGPGFRATRGFAQAAVTQGAAGVKLPAGTAPVSPAVLCDYFQSLAPELLGPASWEEANMQSALRMIVVQLTQSSINDKSFAAMASAEQQGTLTQALSAARRQVVISVDNLRRKPNKIHADYVAISDALWTDQALEQLQAGHDGAVAQLLKEKTEKIAKDLGQTPEETAPMEGSGTKR